MKFLRMAPILLPAILAAQAACSDVADSDADDGPCVPRTCDYENRECGAMSNGCGGMISCGTCDPGFTCRFGACREICVPDCTGRCGGSDGCDGSCPDRCSLTGQTCDANTRECIGECVPRSCVSLGYECGTWDDGCGGSARCGDCLPGAPCDDGRCGAIASEGLGVRCESDPAVCRAPFPDCIKLSGDPAFCSRECLSDGQCGIAGTDTQGNPVPNCCVPIDGVGRCVSADLMSWMCEDPTDASWCTIDETCLPSPLGACIFCFPVGQLTVGDACSGFNSCDKGLACVKPVGDNKAACHEICDPADMDACIADGQDRHCVAMSELGAWGVCVDGPPPCDPSKLGATCPTAWNCVPDAACSSFACSKTGGKAIGEPCSEYDACARGGYCADGTCREMCSVSDGCPDSYECVQGCGTKIRYCNPVGGNDCNPLLPKWLCLAGQTCVPDSLSNCAAGTCVVAGKTGGGGGCDAHSDCVYGSICYNDACRPICTLSRTCEPPSYCFYICGGSDLGVCMTG